MLRQRIRLPNGAGSSSRILGYRNHSYISPERQFSTPTLAHHLTTPHIARRPTQATLLRIATSSKRLFSNTSVVGGNFPFKLHDIGEGIAEVELLKWHVEVGQAVDEFDVLCEVQSDKSTVELTSPVVGVVRRLGAEEGVVVKVGQLICDIETPSEAGEAHAEPEQSTPSERDQHDKPAQSTQSPEPETEVHRNESTPIPEISEQTSMGEKEPEDASLFASKDPMMDTAGSGAQFSGEAAMLPSAPPPPPRRAHHHDVSAPVERREGNWGEMRRIVKASPAVRTLAARMEVDLSQVKGSGEGGRVLGDDIRLHASGGSSSSSGPGSGAGVGGREVHVGSRDTVEKTTRVDFGRTRKVMYRAMGEMGQVPHFGYSHTLDLTPLLPYMRSLNPPISPNGKAPYLANDIPSSLARDPLLNTEGGGREKTTILTFLIKGLLLAMEEHPIMRSRAKESGGDRWLEVARDPTIAVAVSDPKYGLLTPSLPPLNPSTPLSALTSHLTDLRLNASKPTSPGSITISSVGSLGECKGAMPVLPPGGGVAICAVGRASWGMEWKATRREKRGVWDWTPAEVEQGGMEAVLRCPVGWSGDHRVLEGAELIAFTETWKKYIEEPWRWIKVDG